MNFRPYPRPLLACFTLGLASASVSNAQQKVTTTTSSVAYATPQFLWFNTQNAIRIGTVSNSTPWNIIGTYSLAFGQDAEATGSGTFAFGLNAAAKGYAGHPDWESDSFAFGSYSYADAMSMALGNGATATGSGMAFGYLANASNGGVAMGAWSSASGGVSIGGAGYAQYGAVALGEAFAYGTDSVALMRNAFTAGSFSMAVGPEAWATSDYSFALGGQSHTYAWGQVAIGVGNAGNRKDGTPIDPDTPSSSDPIFEVARSDPARGDPWNGVAPGKNALTIYRDGQAHFLNTVRVKASGDIPMTGFQSIPAGVVFP